MSGKLNEQVLKITLSFFLGQMSSFRHSDNGQKSIDSLILAFFCVLPKNYNGTSVSGSVFYSESR